MALSRVFHSLNIASVVYLCANLPQIHMRLIVCPPDNYYRFGMHSHDAGYFVPELVPNDIRLNRFVGLLKSGLPAYYLAFSYMRQIGMTTIRN